MGDTNVKIKLTADGAGVRRELKLIDREIQQLGGSQGAQKASSSTNSKSDTKETTPAVKRDSSEITKQESRDKTNERLSRELTLIRKELWKMNGNRGYFGGGGGNNTPPPWSGGPTGSGGNVPPSGGNGQGAPVPTGGGKLSDVLGKLATAAVAMKAASAAFSYIRQGAASSRSGESLAYQTYGSTLMYTDYYKAKKDAYEIGVPYGYDYQTVMSAGDANMSKAGFTTVENYTNDMNYILKGAKGWGIDANSLANTTGYMSSIGVTASGNQDKFVKMLSQSIVDAKMTGREDEQLQVLEQIAESLAGVSTTVSENALGNQLNMYNALVAQNENLKGTRGANVLSDIAGVARSKDTSLDILAGYGTKYTGIQGKLALRELAETDYVTYMNQAIAGGKSMGLSDDALLYKLSEMGVPVQEAREYLNAYYANGSTGYSGDTSQGEEQLDKNNANYDGSDVSTQERYDINTKIGQEAAGEGLNNVMNPAKELFNGLPTWAQGTLGVVGSAAPYILGGLGAKFGGKLVGKFGGKLSDLWKGLFGGKAAGAAASAGTGAAAGAASAADDVIDLVEGADGVWRMPSSADDVARAAGSVDDAIESGSTALSVVDDEARILGSVDDVARAAGGADDALKAVSGLSKFAKGAAVVGTVVEGGIGAYQAYKAHERGDDREMAQEIGETTGSIGGGLGGAAAGAAAGAAIGTVVPGIGNLIGAGVGGLIGAFGGSWAGEKVGGAAGEAIYDGVTGGDTYDLTDDEKRQIQAYADKVQEIYDEDGRKAATKYVKDYVSPYLNSLGVSTSITDKYNVDWGKNDFLKDIENEKFGDLTVKEPEREWTEEEKEAFRRSMSKLWGDVSSGAQWIGGKASDWLGLSTSTTSDSYLSDVVKGAKNSGLSDEAILYKLTQSGLSKKEAQSYLDSYNNGETGLPDAFNTKENTTALEENTKALNSLSSGLGISTDSTSTTSDKGSQANNDRNDNPMSNSTTQGAQIGFWQRWFGPSIPRSHAVGNTYVPHDNYLASLHKGEMVLTEAEATDYRQGKAFNSSNSGQVTGSIDININLNGGVTGMTPATERQLVEAVRAQLTTNTLQQMLSNGYRRMQNY